jgi:UDP-N-acetylglucosamine 2-epimerase (non-hydrolysing)
MTPIGIVFGTRPEYLKVKPLFNLFEEKKIAFQILHVSQHIDLEIEEKDHANYTRINIVNPLPITRLNELASNLPRFLEEPIQKCKSILVQGDTATAFFAAVTAFHCKKPIFHLEAGLRTYDLQNPFPEEAYRSMISRIATYHLCPDETAKQNLLKEGITNHIYIVGNTILDLVKSYHMTSQIGTLVLITVHRRENWDQLPQIATSIHALAAQRPDLHFVWIYHPNPVLQEIVSSTISALGSLSNLQFQQPCSHRTLCQYIHDAYCIITDSGGIQEEASFLGKQAFVIRNVTERSGIPEKYIHLVKDHTRLEQLFLERKIHLLESCTCYGRGDASVKIVEIMKVL